MYNFNVGFAFKFKETDYLFFFNTFCGYILPQIKIIIIMNLSLLQTRMGWRS